MERFIPAEKRSKKERRKMAAAGRGSWNGVNPVTRKVESKKHYSRKRNPFGKAAQPDQMGFAFCQPNSSRGQ